MIKEVLRKVENFESNNEFNSIHFTKRVNEPWKYWMHSAASFECEFAIFLHGPITQEGIDKMIKHLELVRDQYPPQEFMVKDELGKE